MCLIIIALLTGSAANVMADGSSYKFDELVCRMEDGFDISAVLDSFDLDLKGYQQPTNCYLLGTQGGMDAESLAQIISGLPQVQYCGANYYLDAPEPYQRSQPFLDNNYIGDINTQPAVATLSLLESNLISTGEDVKIAVIDGGVNLTHPEFSTKSAGIHSGWDFIDNDSLAFDEPGGAGSGHGTFVAGIIKLTAPGAEIYAYRALDTLGRGDGYTLADAVLRAIDDSCKVINLSLGMIGRHEALDDAIKFAEKNHVIVVAAAGNDSTAVDYLFPFPATKANCIAVSALDSNNVKAEFSNYGQKTNLCAPGVNIYAPYLESYYAWWDGTSFSAPFVSGTAALIVSIAPQLSWETIDTILYQSAVNLDTLNPGLEGLLGAGLVDPRAALRLTIERTCGDCNNSGSVNVSDVVYLVNYVFTGGPEPITPLAGDPDCSGNINVTDAVYLINYIFSSGPEPCHLCK